MIKASTALLTPEQQAKYQQLERGPGGVGGFHSAADEGSRQIGPRGRLAV